jgi:membrane protein DedA with SNARE-associated domain
VEVLPYSLLGGLLWATTVTILGYVAGASWSWSRIQVGVVSNVVIGVLAAAGLAMWLRSHVWRWQSRL